MNKWRLEISDWAGIWALLNLAIVAFTKNATTEAQFMVWLPISIATGLVCRAIELKKNG